MSTQRTHWSDCWKSGPEHYECAVAVAEDAHKAQRQAENDLSQYMARCAMAEAEVLRLCAEKDAVKVAAWDKFASAVGERNALRADVERLRANIRAIEDEKNSYIDYVGDALGQDHDDESLWDAAQRVLSDRDRVRVERDELSEQLTEARIERDALRADAERYRWLRRAALWTDEVCAALSNGDPDAIDAAIDTARGSDAPQT